MSGLILLVWYAGFLAVGTFYFIPRNIQPFDEFGLPALIVFTWPVAFPIYLIWKWVSKR